MFILPEAIDSKIVNMRVKKAIKYHIDVKPPWKTGKRALDKWLKEAGLFQLKDELVEEILSAAPKKRRKKYYIDAALEATGLLNKKDRKFSRLTPLDYLLFLIARALLQSPTIIMFLLPKGLLGRLEFEKFSDYVEKIKKLFHIVLIFYGPKEIVSKCDQILIITEKRTEIGNINELIEKMPQSGEILSIELNRAVEAEIKKMLELKSAIIIEERKNEKFKIFLKEDPDKALLQVMEIFGPKLYSFKRFKATLGEYLEFLERG